MAITTSDLFQTGFELNPGLGDPNLNFGSPFPFPIIISNNQAFKFLIYFKNEDCEKTLNVNAIQELEIVDNILNWDGLRGYLVFEDKMNVFERGDVNINSTTNSQFIFRNDGRDFLRIEIYPVDINKKGREVPDEWKVLYTFSITNIEDVPTENNINKFKKISFCNAKYAYLKQLNMNWSTATTTNNEVVLNLSEKEEPRSLLVSDALQAILKDSFNLLSKIDPNFPSDQQVVDENNWENSFNKIFYTSPLKYTVADDINYLQSLCIEREKQDFCIFAPDRTSQLWYLKSIHKIFEEANKNQIAHGILEEMSKLNKSSLMFAPIVQEPGKMNLDIPCKVNRFVFNEMTSQTNLEKISNRPVFTYDYITKKFYNNTKDNTSNTIKSYITNNYLLPLKNNLSSSNGDFDYVNLGINKLKTLYKNINPIRSEYNQSLNTIPNVYGRNAGLYHALFSNQNISMDIEGATYFKSGKIMAIESAGQCANKWDYKLMGQWLITEVKLIWHKNIFRSQVSCVKPYAVGKLNINENVL